MPSTPTPALAAQLAAAVAALGAVSMSVAAFRAADDAALLELNRLAARERQLAEAHLALIAGEIAARSTREMGHSGLAQREGFRSPEELVKVTTGATGREAVSVIRVGRLVREASLLGEVDPATGEPFQAQEPWLAAVATAVAAGTLSVNAAEAIRTGLGTPSGNVPAGLLAAAAERLVAEQGGPGPDSGGTDPAGPGAAVLDPDRLLRRARELRDDLDEAGIADRERERFQKRSLRHYRLPNGMGRISWDLDPESYAAFVQLYDRATSPKRGVRFVSGDQKETAERILADERSIHQLASDTLLALLQAGAAADSSQLLGTGSASIRVLVTRTALETRDGHGHIEGLPDPISIDTVERLACDGTSTEISIDPTGQPLDVGREQRFFTRKQKIALAVRDGGCLFGHCDTPPWMTEAHHIQYWARDSGRTDIKDGVCLCKFHHLLLHNNGWEIIRRDDQNYLIPPKNIDPGQRPVRMPSKSPGLHDLRRENAEVVGGEVG